MFGCRKRPLKNLHQFYYMALPFGFFFSFVVRDLMMLVLVP